MKRILVFLVLVVAAGTALAQEERIAAGTALAQEERIAAGSAIAPGKSVLCPHPYNQTFTAGPPAAPAPIVSTFPANVQATIAGSVWNQTTADKHFGHTFRFPSERQCCLITSGRLEVTIKALQTAKPNSGGSSNDAVHVIANGASVTYQQPWLSSGVTVGTVHTVTFQLNAQQLAGGTIGIFVQDDVAVQSAKLTVTGCCIRKP
ncbi:MAG TPA: hypothetical protein VF432_21500 [Thermoanaerobaculia bacterium]